MDKRAKARKSLRSQAEPVPLAVAASLVYHHLNRNIGSPAGGTSYQAALDSTALALSQVSDVYSVERGRLLRIPSEDLAAGSFEGGADVYRSAGGKVYRELSMRRIDVMQAMSTLRSASVAIHAAKSKAGSHG